MGQQISEEEKKQFSLQFWKLWKYRLISRLTWLPRNWNIKTSNFVLRRILRINMSLILDDLVIQNAGAYKFY